MNEWQKLGGDVAASTSSPRLERDWEAKVEDFERQNAALRQAIGDKSLYPRPQQESRPERPTVQTTPPVDIIDEVLAFNGLVKQSLIADGLL